MTNCSYMNEAERCMCVCVCARKKLKKIVYVPVINFCKTNSTCGSRYNIVKQGLMRVK